MKSPKLEENILCNKSQIINYYYRNFMVLVIYWYKEINEK